MSFKRRRSLPAWKTPDLEKSSHMITAKSKTQEILSLEHCPIKSGSCRWAFEVVESSEYFWIGMHGMVLGKLRFWGFKNDGTVYSSIKFEPRSLLRFETGSKVTFKLNLASDDEGNGTLGASVDGGIYHELIRNLRIEIDGNCDGFVPAVSMNKPGCIKLLDFKLDP